MSGRVVLHRVVGEGGFTGGTVPNEGVNLSFERGASPMAAWREHLGIMLAELAARIPGRAGNARPNITPRSASSSGPKYLTNWAPSPFFSLPAKTIS